MEVDFDHPSASTYFYIFVRFYFCEKHSVKEIEEALGIDLNIIAKGRVYTQTLQRSLCSR